MRSTHSTRYRLLLARLRLAREESGLTQENVAREVGKPQSYVSKCESGERRVDAIELLELAQVYRRPLAYFVGEESDSGASLTGPVSRVRPKRRRRR